MKNRTKVKRRKALASLILGGLGATAAIGADRSSTAGTSPEAPSKPVLFHVGCQHGSTDDQYLEFLARYGVFHFDAGAPRLVEGVGWDLDDAMAKREAKGLDNFRQGRRKACSIRTNPNP